MRIKILLFKEFIIFLLLLGFGCGFLFYGLDAMQKESLAISFADLNLLNCEKGQLVSGTVSSYVTSNNSGVSAVLIAGGLAHDFYTVPVGSGLYIRIMSADRKTLAALEAFADGKGAPVSFEGQIISSPIPFNEEWYRQSEEFKNGGQENIIKNFVIRQADIKSRKNTAIAGFLLLAAALLWFFYAGRLKGLFPPDTP